MKDNQMIQTPYGKKRWSFLKRCMDNHESMLATLQGILTYVEDGNVVELRPCGFIEEVKAAIAKATT